MNAEQTRLVVYLRDAVQRGHRYFKAKHIGNDLGLSSRTVGADMKRLSEYCKELSIRRWGRSGSFTWFVELPGSGI
jgi:hypothetical protein